MKKLFQGKKKWLTIPLAFLLFPLFLLVGILYLINKVPNKKLRYGLFGLFGFMMLISSFVPPDTNNQAAIPSKIERKNEQIREVPKSEPVETLEPLPSLTPKPTPSPSPTQKPTVVPIKTAKPIATTKPVQVTPKPESTQSTTTPQTLLSGGDKDCPDFATHAEAQAYFIAKGGSATNNVDRLDNDHDGIACENNP